MLTRGQQEKIDRALRDGEAAHRAGLPRKAPSPAPWSGYTGWWLMGYDNARLDAAEAARKEQETRGVR